MDVLYPVRTHMSACLAGLELGGITPPCGPLLLSVVGPRPHPCPNRFKGHQASHFSVAQV